jgi:hypothetical protein
MFSVDERLAKRQQARLLSYVCPRCAVNSPPLFSGLRGRYASRFNRGLAGFCPRLPVTGHELKRPEDRRVIGIQSDSRRAIYPYQVIELGIT